jgi:SAM-dependent methyltransferase
VAADSSLSAGEEPGTQTSGEGAATLRSTFVPVTGEWDHETQNWLRWARTPGFDAYWYYRDAFLDAVLPPQSGRTLEVGCGEGRVARDLTERGYHVTALDSAGGLVRYTREADSRKLLPRG